MERFDFVIIGGVATLGAIVWLVVWIVQTEQEIKRRKKNGTYDPWDFF